MKIECRHQGLTAEESSAQKLNQAKKVTKHNNLNYLPYANAQ